MKTIDVEIEGLKTLDQLQIGDWTEIKYGKVAVKTICHNAFDSGYFKGLIHAGAKFYRPTPCEEGYRYPSDEEHERFEKQGFTEDGWQWYCPEERNWSPADIWNYGEKWPRHHYRIKLEPEMPPIPEGFRLANWLYDKDKKFEAYMLFRHGFSTSWEVGTQDEPSWGRDRAYIVKDKPERFKKDGIEYEIATDPEYVIQKEDLVGNEGAGVGWSLAIYAHGRKLSWYTNGLRVARPINSPVEAEVSSEFDYDGEILAQYVTIKGCHFKVGDRVQITKVKS